MDNSLYSDGSKHTPTNITNKISITDNILFEATHILFLNEHTDSISAKRSRIWYEKTNKSLPKPFTTSMGLEPGDIQKRVCLLGEISY